MDHWIFMSLHWAELDWSATSEVIFNTRVPGIEGVPGSRELWLIAV